MPLDPHHLDYHFDRAIDEDGPTLVNHQGSARLYPKTPQHESLRNDYQINVENVGSHIANDLNVPGSVSKVFVKTPQNQFMVKAYHEPVAFAGTDMASGHYPYSGFAESVTQALYHAAGLGHIIQHSHVTEHSLSDGTKHPFLVIGFDKTRLKPAGDFHKSPGPRHYHPDLYLSLGKMGALDFLTNNIDRTGNNTLWGTNPDSGKSDVLAIDHQYALQYLHPLQAVDEGFRKHRSRQIDYLMDYWTEQNGIAAFNHPDAVLNRNSVNKVLDPDNIRKVGAWWLKNSANVRTAFNKSLELIKDPKVKQFLMESYHDRHRVLDNFAVAFANAPVLDYFGRDGAGAGMASVKMRPHTPAYPWGSQTQDLIEG